jgi:phosphoserine phosphatase
MALVVQVPVEDFQRLFDRDYEADRLATLLSRALGVLEACPDLPKGDVDDFDEFLRATWSPWASSAAALVHDIHGEIAWATRIREGA